MSFTTSPRRSSGFTVSIWILVSILLSINLNLTNAYLPTCPRLSKTTALQALSREDEIRRQIVQLKKQGKIRSDGSTSSEPSETQSYDDKIRSKLGKKKSKMLGFGGDDDFNEFEGTEQDLDELKRIQAELEEDAENENKTTINTRSPGQIGSLPETSATTTQETAFKSPEDTSSALESEDDRSVAAPTDERKPMIDPSLFEEEEQEELSEEDLVEIVAQKLAEKARAAEQKRAEEAATNRAATVEQQTKAKEEAKVKSGRTTSGVGGKWENEDGESPDLYKPKTGSWGAFPRPRNISTAYGGGRRVGAGYSKEEDGTTDMNTKKLLQDYRRKVGIDVPSEKEHASEIEEALKIGKLAMQRGIYATAVSALEKVTRWCSTNSKVGSKVYLELAMAYEAVGRTEEAMQVYRTLTQCRMEDVKFNAKRLLYGIEAMELMKGVSSDFSRKKIKNTFMDATGLRDIAQNFDDVYQTAYVDTEGSFYRRLTQAAVRSNREARQILLKATGKGEVPRLRIIQALRSIARYFDDALEAEIAANTKVEPTAYIDGKPLIVKSAEEDVSKTSLSLDEFVLASSDQMIENLEGTWQLQLLADKTGDGVDFFNTTIATQTFFVGNMTFSASGPSGLARVEKFGNVTVESEKRILSRSIDSSSNDGGFFAFLGGGSNSGFGGAVSREQQIVSVDSVLLITKSPMGSRRGKDAEKEHFGVWRKVV